MTLIKRSPAVSSSACALRSSSACALRSSSACALPFPAEPDLPRLPTDLVTASRTSSTSCTLAVASSNCPSPLASAPVPGPEPTALPILRNVWASSMINTLLLKAFRMVATIFWCFSKPSSPRVLFRMSSATFLAHKKLVLNS